MIDRPPKDAVQASRLSITHTRNRCCQAKLEHGREDAAARSEGNPTLRCCAAGEQSSARPTPYQYRPHCRFQDIQTSKRSSLYPYSPCSYSTRREATRRLASARPICRQDVTEILRNHSVKLPQAMRHDRKETRRICARPSHCILEFGEIGKQNLDTGVDQLQQEGPVSGETVFRHVSAEMLSTEQAVYDARCSFWNALNRRFVL